VLDFLKSIPTMFKRREPDYATRNEELARQQYDAMRDAISRETPMQTRRFYLEVAALMGNESAAKQLAALGKD